MKFDPIYSGFAAGCESGLCPAVSLKNSFRLSPWYGLCPSVWAKGRTKGLARKLEGP